MTENQEPTPMEPPTSLDFREALDVVSSYRWWIAATTVAVGVLALLVTLWLPKVFEATCTLEFDLSAQSPLGEDADVAMPVGTFLMTREFFETQNRIVASRGVAERVVTRLQLHRSPDFLGVPAAQHKDFRGVSPARAAQALQRRLEVEPIKGTRIVRINVKDHDPERAATIANSVADAYIDKTMEDRLGTTVSALEWLDTQVDSLRGELEATERALHEFKKEHGILSVSMEDRQEQLAHDIRLLGEALTRTKTHRIELEARLGRLLGARDPSGKIDASSLPHEPAMGALQASLREKEAERDRIATTYGPNHPTRRSLDAEIETLNTQLADVLEGRLASARADVAEVVASERQLASALDELNRFGLELNLQEIEYRKLNREQENNSKIYQMLLQRTTETDMARLFRVTHARVVDRALPPVRPVSPNVPLNASAGLAVGLAVGLGIAFLRRRLDLRLKRPEDVEALGLPLLGIVPVVPDVAMRERANGSPPAAPPDPIIVRAQPRSSAAECFRTVRTNLTFMSASEPIRAFVVTSAVPEEGKTTVAANLAAAIAQSGRRVLLIDTDLRRPRIHRVFSLPNRVGVTTAVVGTSSFEESVVSSGIEGLDVMTCGPIPPNPSELLHSDGFGRLLDYAKTRYDRVIFDSPPLNAVTDAAVLAPQVDGTVFVVSAGSTHRDALRFAVRQLRDVKARVLGAVLNSVDLEPQRYGYGNRYGYYYAREPYEADPAGAGPSAA